ncbi:helix-turn-helix transcriptional regulator [Chloroflexota bacterium]
MEPLAVNVVTASEMLSLSKSTVYLLIEQDAIPHVHITEKRVILPVEALRNWLKEQQGGGSQ